MPAPSPFSRYLVLALAWSALATASAQAIRTESIGLQTAAAPTVIDGRISGGEIVDYRVSGQAAQILSVDLKTSNPANYFNISLRDSPEALFIGSTAGTVADLPLPESGDYIVRVYLMPAAARRDESASFSLALALGAPEFADALFGGPDYWEVRGLERDALNVRAGPDTRYAVVSLLRNGDVLANRGCRLTGTERWCSIRAYGSGVTGWVAGRYLVEAAAPPRPRVPDGGPEGNGTPFDATGYLPCAREPDRPAGQCIFGVVREGPGNAGVWIAVGDGSERHILFEAGTPVATDGADSLEVERQTDLFRIRIGSERYDIPFAVVYGG